MNEFEGDICRILPKDINHLYNLLKLGLESTDNYYQYWILDAMRFITKIKLLKIKFEYIGIMSDNQYDLLPIDDKFIEF